MVKVPHSLVAVRAVGVTAIHVLGYSIREVGPDLSAFNLPQKDTHSLLGEQGELSI